MASHVSSVMRPRPLKSFQAFAVLVCNLGWLCQPHRGGGGRASSCSQTSPSVPRTRNPSLPEPCARAVNSFADSLGTTTLSPERRPREVK